jgi:DNA mismatch repair protein MutL
MATIRQLDAGLINKIAAGEVIERPASVVKELVENSLDAGARRIDVQIRGGGLELIRIADDGAGIAAEELPLAVTSHATSKIAKVDDLFHVESFGFRGEALASISEVSRFTLRSRTRDAEHGATLTVDGGRWDAPQPCASPPGTIIEVRDLFFNTPVRRRFLRTPQTELGNISEALTRLALVHETVHFTLTHNDREILDVPPVETWITRIKQLFGGAHADLLPFESDEPGLRIHGFVGHPAQDRGNNRMQYLFLNGRYIRDRALAHALQEAYRGLLMVGRHPIGFLHFELPPDQFDINVHPTKLEVRFVDASRLYGQLLGSLRSMFLAQDLSNRGSLEKAPGLGQGGSAGFRAAPAIPHGTGTSGWSFPPPVADLQRPSSSNRTTPAVYSQPRFEMPNLPSVPLAGSSSPMGVESPNHASSHAGTGDSESPEVAPRRTHAHTSEGTPAMQVCNRYLVTESDDGIVVIDQHALHERILYEELKQRVGIGGLERQKLLIPEPVDLTPAEMGVVLGNVELVGRLGIDVEPFSGNTVIVLSYPSLLSNIPPVELLRDVAERMLNSPRTIEPSELFDELLHSIACKAAIKAGDRLTNAEVQSLLDRRHMIHDAHHCPHGRPTTLVFSRDDLDRQFGRI